LLLAGWNVYLCGTFQKNKRDLEVLFGDCGAKIINVGGGAGAVVKKIETLKTKVESSRKRKKSKPTGGSAAAAAESGEGRGGGKDKVLILTDDNEEEVNEGMLTEELLEVIEECAGKCNGMLQFAGNTWLFDCISSYAELRVDDYSPKDAAARRLWRICKKEQQLYDVTPTASEQRDCHHTPSSLSRQGQPLNTS
jgi:hypothetical protein